MVFGGFEVGGSVGSGVMDVGFLGKIGVNWVWVGFFQEILVDFRGRE